MKRPSISKNGKMPEMAAISTVAPPLSTVDSKTLPTNFKINLPEQERLHVAVRVRPLHVVTELGHENIIEVDKDQITVKSDLSHDLKAKYDIVLSNSS